MAAFVVGVTTEGSQVSWLSWDASNECLGKSAERRRSVGGTSADRRRNVGGTAK